MHTLIMSVDLKSVIINDFVSNHPTIHQIKRFILLSLLVISRVCLQGRRQTVGTHV